MIICTYFLHTLFGVFVLQFCHEPQGQTSKSVYSSVRSQGKIILRFHEQGLLTWGRDEGCNRERKKESNEGRITPRVAGAGRDVFGRLALRRASRFDLSSLMDLVHGFVSSVPRRHDIRLLFSLIL